MVLNIIKLLSVLILSLFFKLGELRKVPQNSWLYTFLCIASGTGSGWGVVKCLKTNLSNARIALDLKMGVCNSLHHFQSLEVRAHLQANVCWALLRLPCLRNEVNTVIEVLSWLTTEPKI